MGGHPTCERPAEACRSPPRTVGLLAQRTEKQDGLGYAPIGTVGCGEAEGLASEWRAPIGNPESW